MEFFDKTSLLSLADDYISVTTATGIDHMSYKQFESNKDSIIDKMSKNISNEGYVFTRYREVLIIKDRYSIPRCISIPTLRDKVCLAEMLNWLKEVYKDFPEIVKPELPQQSIASVYQHINQDSSYTAFIKLDITNFFDSINHYRLFQILAKRVPLQLLKLLKMAIRNPTFPDKNLSMVGVPQGLPISNILSQIYMYTLAKEVKEKYNYVFISRYVDDVIILCRNKDVDSIKIFFQNLIKEEYMLSINSNKVSSGRLVNKGFDFLGYRFMPKGRGKKKLILSVRRSSIEKMRIRLLHIMTHYKKQAKQGRGLNFEALKFELNITISGSINAQEKTVNGISVSYKKRYGWLFFFSQLNDYSVLYNLDVFVQKKSSIFFQHCQMKKSMKYIVL